MVLRLKNLFKQMQFQFQTWLSMIYSNILYHYFRPNLSDSGLCIILQSVVMAIKAIKLKCCFGQLAMKECILLLNIDFSKLLFYTYKRVCTLIIRYVRWCLLVNESVVISFKQFTWLFTCKLCKILPKAKNHKYLTFYVWLKLQIKVI